MPLNDHEYVNFSQDYELNYHLKKVDKRQTEDNRNELREMGKEIKKALNALYVRHDVFHEYIKKNLHRLD